MSKSIVKNKNEQYLVGPASVFGNSVNNDGKTHINIYTRGATELGRALSHFPYFPFEHPYFASFHSMEGFWYFIRSGFKDDRLRFLSGNRAKKVGKELPIIRYEHFKEDIMAANYQKIIQHDQIYEMMIESKLPFDHYYIFDKNTTLNPVHVTPKPSEWLVEGFEQIRASLQQGQVPECWTNAEKRYMNRMK